MDICDDGDEATVYFTATHGHFSCDEEKLSIEQREQQITDDVITFLDSLFKDRVVIWQVLGGLAGGWRVLQPGRGCSDTVNGTPSVSLDKRDTITIRLPQSLQQNS
jgi:hypothetical protein